MATQSPLHCWHKAFSAVPEPFDDARNFGLVAHAVLLGGQSLQAVEAPDWRTAKAREERQEAVLAGKLPVLLPRLQQAVDLIARIAPRLADKGIVLSGKSEETLSWRHEKILCQGTLDHIIRENKHAQIYDFKFITGAATKRACENRIIEHGYDIQHAAYIEAVESNFPKLGGRVEMTFIFAEIHSPHGIRIMPLAPGMRASGKWRWDRACEQWADCLSRFGVNSPWPGYLDDGEPAECPPWALREQIGEASEGYS